MSDKRFFRLAVVFFVLALVPGWVSLQAQTGGQGAISGSVTDASGAAIPQAALTATNVATGVSTETTASGSGVYTLGGLIPGKYTLTVKASGFATFKQENLVVDALSTLGFNAELKAGSTNETVTVSAAPPALDTTEATLGGVIENDMYASLPLLIAGNQQRDVTQFSNLLPGAQVNPGGRSSIIAGTGQRVGELYVDGLPLTTASQQGDNRPVFNLVPLEAIDQIKVVTSGYSAQYQGAGLENYNLKAGGNQYHGSLFAYVRNTIFDAWTFSSKPGSPGNMVPQVVNGTVTLVPGPKPGEHQIEYGYAVGGPISIPHLVNGHNKLFFFTTLDRFRSRVGVNATPGTVPTLKMRTGDFSELLTANGGPGYVLYDPTTQSACTANNGGKVCRYPYGQAPNGPVDTTKATNIIPASQISPISQYMAKFLPTPFTSALTSNYFSGVPSGFDNWLVSGRVDYTISSRHTISGAYTQGNRHAIPYTGTAAPGIAVVPYLTTTVSVVAGKIADVEDTFQITPKLVNQARFAYIYFGGPPVGNITGTTNPGLYGLAASGVTGLPDGQASMNAANLAFSGSNAPTSWVGNTPTTTNRSLTYEVLDNLAYLKGRHSMNFGGELQWLENNADTADGPSTPTSLNYGVSETANVSGTSFVSGTGYSYASFLIGAVASSSVTQQAFSVVGGRYRPGAVYFQDDFKLTKKLTINAGLRWDYIPPYHESQNRWSFLNPDLANPLTGNGGALQFAGDRGAGLSCRCTTPVRTYWKNFEPRVGFAYAIDSKTVFRGGYSLSFSHGGATGGAAGAGTGTGQTGFSTPLSFTDSTAGPAFYLNNNAGFSAANSTYGGPGYSLPGTSAVSAASQTLGTGYYVTAANTSGGTGTGINYADPYIGSRAPEFSFFNFGMQREITRSLTISVDYAGSQSHFISGAGGIRGLYAGQLDPKYLALGNANCSTTSTFASCLTAAATPANLAKAQSLTGLALNAPYAGYTAFASLNSTTGTQGTIAHMLVWKPQYSGTSDFWGNYVANGNYNSLQIALAQRASHGLTFNVNYTYAQNVDDAGTQRSGYDIPASVIADGQFHPKNRIDRSISINDQPQNLSIYGVYNSQYGKHSWGGDHLITRALLSGWQTSLIFQLSSGLPLPIVATCQSTQNVGQGTCMPDVNPNFHGDVRINGKWGEGVTAKTLGSKSYLVGSNTPGSTVSALGTTPGNGSGTYNGTTATAATCASSLGPFCNSGTYMIGDAPRFPYNLRGPDNYRLNMALRRQFSISDRLKFTLGVDGSNLTNHTTFGNNVGNNQIQVNVNNAAFGTLNFASADPRDFQFSGRFSF
ncbi:MAG: carboxypeptidase regulatory-like domain-containing protein [Acidobacteriota bacterium]